MLVHKFLELLHEFLQSRMMQKSCSVQNITSMFFASLWRNANKIDMWVTHYFWFYGHYIFAELLISHLANWFIQIKSILQRECQIRATNLRHERHWYNTSATRATQVKNFYLWIKGDVFLYFKKLKVMWINKE